MGVLQNGNSPIQRLDFAARNIRPLIPTLRHGEQRGIPLLPQPLAPVIFALLRGLEPCNTLVLDHLKRAFYPLGLELRTARAGRERSGSLRSIEEKHIRKLGHGNTHGGARAVFPVVCNRAALGALDVELGQRTRHAVEASGQDDDVDFDMTFFGLQAGRCDLFDGALVDVDDADVGLVDDLVEALLEAGPFCAPRMRRDLGRKEFLLLRVRDALEDLPSPEVVGLLVGLQVEQHVLVRCEPEHEPAVIDHEIVVELLAFLGRVVERVALHKVVREPGEGVPGLFHFPLVPARFLLLLFFLGIELALVHWQTHVRSSHEHRQLLDHGTDFLNHLDPAGPRADFGHALALEIHPVLRPYRRVVDVAFEIAQTRERRRVPLRGEPDARDEPPRIDLGAVGALDQPLLSRLVEHGAVDVHVEARVVSDVPFLLDVIEVPA